MTFTPIKGTAASYFTKREDGVRELTQNDKDELTELFVGRRVTKVADDHILLDDGTLIKPIGHDGGCSCSAGCYDLSVLNGVDNIITAIEFDYNPTGDDDPRGYDVDGYYRLFVFADAEKINLMQFDGTDGNGYYGTGFSILVRDPR